VKILVAGATGAIGRPLVPRLLAAGHEVAAITRDDAKAAALRAAGVEPHVADVFDRDAVVAACVAAAPEVVVHQLTALPQEMDIRRYRQALEPTNRLRAEATPHLLEGARAAGARRVVVQSISFLTAPEGPMVHDEDARPYTDAPAAFRDAVEAALAMERMTLAATDLDPVVLRYGFFYGPGTYYAPDGATAKEIARRRFPIVGGGAGTSSFLHIDDAADATVAALQGGASGVYNVTDDEPAPMREWLPHAAVCLGAKRPLRVPTVVGRLAAGAHAVHFATGLRGNSGTRFRETFAWQPSHPSWREGFREALGRTS
jgi:nucleoside-diphosphate-sugar epimerase